MPSAGVEAEFLVLPLLPARFTHVLQGMNEQVGGADLPGLAIRDQFHLPLVGKEHETAFVRQMFPLLDQLDEATPLLRRQVVGFKGGTDCDGSDSVENCLSESPVVFSGILNGIGVIAQRPVC